MPNNISLADAVMLAKNLRLNRELMLSPDYRDRNVIPICESFPMEAIQKLVDLQDCQGIRVYLGMDNNALIRVFLVGYDSEGKDILPISTTSITGEIVEEGMRCPTLCPPPTVLNS